MAQNDREIERRLRILKHAEATGMLAGPAGTSA